MLGLALSWLGAYGSWYLTFQLEYSFRAINAYKWYVADEVFPWVIGCNMLVKLVLEIFHPDFRDLTTFPCLITWPANSEIYIGAAAGVLVCYVSLLRINMSYLCLAIFPFMAVSFIFVLWVRHNRLSGGSTHTDNGIKPTEMPEKFNIVALLAPHFILCVFGLLGDPDHDGNNYDISNFFLFLTCMLR